MGSNVKSKAGTPKNKDGEEIMDQRLRLKTEKWQERWGEEKFEWQSAGSQRR